MNQNHVDVSTSRILTNLHRALKPPGRSSSASDPPAITWLYRIVYKEAYFPLLPDVFYNLPLSPSPTIPIFHSYPRKYIALSLTSSSRNTTLISIMYCLEHCFHVVPAQNLGLEDVTPILNHGEASHSGYNFYFCAVHQAYHCMFLEGNLDQPLCGECAAFTTRTA